MKPWKFLRENQQFVVAPLTFYQINLANFNVIDSFLDQLVETWNPLCSIHLKTRIKRANRASTILFRETLAVVTSSGQQACATKLSGTRREGEGEKREKKRHAKSFLIRVSCLDIRGTKDQTAKGWTSPCQPRVNSTHTTHKWRATPFIHIIWLLTMFLPRAWIFPIKILLGEKNWLESSDTRAQFRFGDLNSLRRRARARARDKRTTNASCIHVN